MGFHKSIKDCVFSGVTLGVSQCLISAMLSLIYYVGALLVDNCGVSIVDLFTAIYAIMFSGVQAGCNIGFVGQIAKSAYGSARYFQVLNLQHKDLLHEMEGQTMGRNELVEELQDESIIGSEPVRGTVEFKGVSFKYPNRK
jgi:ABC-type multidrug transport system fused ATPase/permease subunit